MARLKVLEEGGKQHSAALEWPNAIQAQVYIHITAQV
jgi:hypothetical protein